MAGEELKHSQMLSAAAACQVSDAIDETIKIIRAAETMKRAYLGFREETWDAHIKRIVDRGHILEVHDDSRAPRLYHGIFGRFPESMTKTEEDKQAVLTAMTCQDAHAYMTPFLEKLLAGMPLKVEEVIVRLRTPSRKTVTVYDTGQVDMNNYDHHILRVSSTMTGNVWAVDCTGAQYNIHQTCQPWSHYLQQVSVVGNSLKSDVLIHYVEALATIRGTADLPYRIGLAAAGKFNNAVKDWAETNNNPLQSLVGLRDEEYLALQASMLEAGHFAVSSFVHGTDFTDQRREAGRIDLANPHEGEKSIRLMFMFFGGGIPSGTS